MLGHVCQERDDIVIGRRLDLPGPLNREGGLRFDLGKVGGRNHATALPGATDRQFDSEPALELGLFGPNGGHRGT